MTELRRFAHPWRALAFIVIVLLVAAASYLVGLNVKSSDVALVEAKDERISVYAMVETRVVTDSVRLQGEVASAVVETISLPAPAGAGLPIVTSTRAKIGDRLTSFQLLGVVSDRPIFVYFSDIPLYRDVKYGEKGSDVAGLQKALGIEPDGEFGKQTLASIKSIYKQAGFSVPGGSSPSITMAEFRSLKGTTGIVRSIAAVGEDLSDNLSLATVSRGSAYVAVRATVREADKLKVGTSAKIQSDNLKPLVGKITAISPFREADAAGGKPPGRDITIGIPDESTIASGTPVSVIFGDVGTVAIAVPTVAVRTDAAGSYVLQKRDTGNVRVNVSQKQSADGWTSIDSDVLEIGDHVLVSGQ
ncbi:hypothetical protein HD598_000025 [Neomicrococcus aestuarii]|uniref:Peptidoglycan binding-like domain-containing protein n=1 Tax=Neomicrococcus aestuarii TaxID=556325 RepID=A0A7W8WZ06_9MICC|nr:hypothetical protein [Neomicrococcus aestuarii]MBB5511338.1 hypothetical protein [Neomicrococcus aestuarii]